MMRQPYSLQLTAGFQHIFYSIRCKAPKTSLHKESLN